MRKFFLLVNILMITNFALAQVTINIIPPPTNQLKPSDLWRCIITASSAMGFRVEEIKVELREAKTGLQVESRLKSVVIAGSKTFSFNDFSSAGLTYRNTKLQEAFSKNLNAPDGNYTMCVNIKDEKGEEIASECINQSIVTEVKEEISLQLILPSDESTFNLNQPILFTWTVKTNYPTSNYAYKLKVVEMLDNQSAAVAVNKNEVWFESNEIRTPLMQYPTSAKKLEPGKKYAWSVRLINNGSLAADAGGNIEEAFMFSIENLINETRVEAIPQLITPADGSSIDIGFPVVFTWIVQTNNPAVINTYKLKLVELTGNQSASEAVKRSPVWFESDELKTPVLQYPHSARKLEPGNKYAWTVQIINKDSKGVDDRSGTADAFIFTVEKPIAEEKPGQTNLQLISPVDGAELIQNQPVLFSWLLSSLKPRTSIIYKIKVVEILGSQSILEAIARNPAWFDKSDITATSLNYPASAKRFEINKKYAWQITAYERNVEIGKSEIWNFIYKENKVSEEITETKQCDVFKVEFKKTYLNDTISYKILITNNYNGRSSANKPASFRIMVKSDFIVSIAGGVTKNWKRTPSKFPPGSSSVIWTNTSGEIPIDSTDLGNLIFRDIYSKPVKMIYEWLNKDENLICKDSSTFFESRFYYELTSELQNNFIELSGNFLNIQFDNNYASNDDVELNIYNIEEFEFVKLKNEKEKRQNSSDKNIMQINNNGLNRISINLTDYELLPKTAYLLIVSDSKKNYYLNFKVVQENEK